MTGIYDRPSPQRVSHNLQQRTTRRLRQLSDTQVQDYLADTVYLERRRFHDQRKTAPATDADLAVIEQAAHATHGSRADMERAILALVDGYAHEIHNVFSTRTHRLATKMIPGALSRLLTSTSKRKLLSGNFNPDLRLLIQTDDDDDDGAALRKLAKTHTLLFAPTHVSNLDSPLIGYALDHLSLPPAIYGAGLNLFNNPLMSFFMSRLGAYTVDRRKRNQLYKDVLKDYSIDSLGRGCHSLFFPGGTRCRSGRIEDSVKKGLLGTAIIAWQEGLERGDTHPEILVVPLTLSFSLVLEAETLIEDSLEEEGKRRYIITDDEFSQPRTVASFTRQLLALDDAVVLRFGAPMDLMGNPVDGDGNSLDSSPGHKGTLLKRTLYVADPAGKVQWDSQRDRVYTSILADRLIKAWHRDNTALSTHVASFAAGRLLRAAHPRLPTAQLVLLPPQERSLDRALLVTAISTLLTQLSALVEQGRIRTHLPAPSAPPDKRADAVLTEALGHFHGFHQRPALAPSGTQIQLQARTVLYYSHRLHGYGLDGEM